MTEYYFEDLEVGDRFEFGSCTITREEIVEFAGRYDPQYFHLDEEAAEGSVLGGLCASGWHTVSETNRMLVDEVFDRMASEGGRGVDELRWHRPVRPGDRLSGWAEVARKEPHHRDESRGNVDLSITVTDQNDDRVLTFVTLNMIRRRNE